MSQVVLDASAAVEIALGTPRGLGLAATLSPDDEAVVPEHFYAEVASALRRMEAGGVLTPERARLALERILTLRVGRVGIFDLIRAAWELRQNLTIGDALYVAVARELNAPLVTADDRLARAPQLGIRIVS